MQHPLYRSLRFYNELQNRPVSAGPPRSLPQPLSSPRSRQGHPKHGECLPSGSPWWPRTAAAGPAPRLHRRRLVCAHPKPSAQDGGGARAVGADLGRGPLSLNWRLAGGSEEVQGPAGLILWLPRSVTSGNSSHLSDLFSSTLPRQACEAD